MIIVTRKQQTQKRKKVKEMIEFNYKEFEYDETTIISDLIDLKVGYRDNLIDIINTHFSNNDLFPYITKLSEKGEVSFDILDRIVDNVIHNCLALMFMCDGATVSLFIMDNDIKITEIIKDFY